MKLVSSAVYAVALFMASVSATPEAAPAPAPAPVPALVGLPAKDAASIVARAQRPREDDMNCWKCPSDSRFTLVGQSKWNKKDWACEYKYDPPIWQFWKLPDKLESGPKECYYDGYYGESTGRQSCSGYSCQHGCVAHMDDTCRTWN